MFSSEVMMTYQLIDDLWKVWFFHDFVTSEHLSSTVRLRPRQITIKIFVLIILGLVTPATPFLAAWGKGEKNSSSRYKAAILPLPPQWREKNVCNVMVLQWLQSSIFKKKWHGNAIIIYHRLRLSNVGFQDVHLSGPDRIWSPNVTDRFGWMVDERISGEALKV